MLVSKVDCMFSLLNNLFNLVFDCFLLCMAVNSMAVNSAWVPREMYISCMYIMSILVLVIICSARGGGGEEGWNSHPCDNIYVLVHSSMRIR